MYHYYFFKLSHVITINTAENRRIALTKHLYCINLDTILISLAIIMLLYHPIFSLICTIHFYHLFFKKAVCDGECLNGGECRKVDLYLPPKCVCTANFTGNYCEKRMYFNITLLVNRFDFFYMNGTLH